MYIMEKKMNKIVFFVFLCFIMTPSNVSAVCTRLAVCEEGQYCDGEECKACDHGFYQEQLRHKEITCKPWTVRHASENWIIVVNGSSTRDVKWDCMPGYVQNNFSLRETECVPLTTTTTTSSTKAPTKSVPSTPAVTPSTTRAAEVVNTKESNLELISLALIIPIVLVVGCLIYHKHCKKGQRSSEGNRTVEDGFDNVPLIRLNEFQEMIREMGLKDARKLIRIIPDPSLQFKAQNRLQFNREKNFDAVMYHATTLCDWLKNNPAIDSKMYLTWALKYIKKGPDNCNSGKKRKSQGAQLLLPYKVKAAISTDQCFHKLCYFIVENLGVELAERFILILDDNPSLNLKTRFDYLRSNFNNEWETSFVDTLADWKSTISQQALVVARFEGLLNELEQNEILDSRIYKLLIREFKLSPKCYAATKICCC